MKNLLKQTGVSYKSPGDGLSAADINKINNSVNETVEVANSFLSSLFNINAEVGDYKKVYSLTTVIDNVPEDRRVPGLCVRFLNARQRYATFIYCGEDASEEEWKNIDNWKSTSTSYDGGEW